MNTALLTGQQTYNPFISNRGITEEGAIRLAEAILEDAYKEYASILKLLNQIKTLENPTILERNRMLSLLKQKDKCEKFYYSDWFQTLTLGASMPPKDVIKKIQELNNYSE